MNAKQIKENSKRAFNAQAATYDKDIQGEHARNLYPYLLNEIIHVYSDRVLDLGCGTGALLEQVLSEDSQRKVTGMDLSPDMLRVAEKRLHGRAELILGDSEELPFEENTFDLVYCCDSFHHFPAPEKVLAEICRVLKYGGTFLIGDCYQPLLSRLIMNQFLRYGRDGDVKIYAKGELLKLMGESFHGLRWQRINSRSFLAKGTK